MKKMLLVDGNSMLFRAFYATLYGRPMSTASGIPTNAVFGFSSMFHKALQMIEPEAILVAFDTSKKTFRTEMFTEYKGTRKELPEELIIQFPMIRDFLDAFDIPRYEVVGYEADDIIGSMVELYKDWDINILSSDKDLLQLIDETTSVWLMKKGLSEIQKMDLVALYEQYQLTPNQIPDLKGLMGDSADNIPGVPGVGEKTALKLLSEFHDIENLYEHTDKIKGKLHENIVTYRKQALLSKQLATIIRQVEIPLTIDQLLFKPNYAKLNDFYRLYEMNSLVKKFADEPTNKQVEIVFKQVHTCPVALLHGGVALYFDHDDFSYYNASLYGLAISDGKETFYLTLEDVRVDEKLLAFLANDESKIVFDNKKNRHILAAHHLVVNGLNFDLMIAASLCDSLLTDWNRIMNQYQIQEDLNEVVIYGKSNKPKFAELEQQIEFSCRRAQTYVQLSQQLRDKLKELNLESLFNDLEMPLSSVLYEMEKQGICVDIKVLDEIALITQKKLDELTVKIYEHAGCEFNINSPKQLQEILFERLQLPSNKKKSTSVEVLEKLVHVHPIISDLMEYRTYQKLFSTYAEGLKKYIFKDSKIHTIFNQCATQTGRLSSSEPNLQNISVRNEEAKEIRKAFLPSPGRLLVSADYSQVELRVLAHMADEHELIEAFKSKLDIHTKTAMDVFGVKKDEITSTMRRQAKAVNFGIVYGISDFGLSQQLGITRHEAQTFIDQYLYSYPNIQTYMDATVNFCQEKGYVLTLLNRRREIKEIHDKNYMMREFGKRAAMNAPIQGTAADLIKLAMIKIDQRMKEKACQSTMILQVHDELIFDVVEDELEMMKEIIQQGMETAMQLKAPLVAECSVGKNWYDAK